MVGPPDAHETVRFIRHMDKFFDCLNVRNFDEHMRKRKPNLKPYSDPDDARFEWLQRDFLGYFRDWEQSVMDREGHFTKTERNAMCISKQTIEGLKMTVNSFVEVSRYLLQQGVNFVLSEKFCQDPLEEHFSKHRQRGGANNDPTIQAFGYQENVIRLQKSHHLRCITGNTRRQAQDTPEVIEDTPLPKRR
ncbi:uncharacterized protein [Ptychodera flava]|uniref:uncharacterized protein n=1 Tax=Ptychodera flava TaxID=63121 RepID=UPI00396A32B1